MPIECSPDAVIGQGIAIPDWMLYFSYVIIIGMVVIIILYIRWWFGPCGPER